MKAFATVVAAVATFAAPTAGAGTIQLIQGGWSEGGPLNIKFSGDDTDLSGSIDTGELTGFFASFKLPGMMGEATWSLADLGADGFAFTSTEDYFIKADSGLYSLYTYAFSGDTVAIVSDWAGSEIHISGDSLQEVPEPGTAALLLAAGIGLGARKLRSGR